MEKKSLRIVRVITWLPLGGIEKRISSVLPRLKDRGHHVEIVCLREYGPLVDSIREKGIPVSLIPLKTRLHPPSLWKLSQFFKTGKFDIIHSHMYRSNVPATISARLAKFKGTVIAQVHNVDTWETRRQLMMDRLLCKWRDGIIGVSESVCDDIVEHLNVEKDKCFVLYNGIEVEKFRNTVPRSDLRESLGLKDNDIVVIMIARLVAQKNHSMVLSAVTQIVKDTPNAKFMFVGDGKLRESLEEEARSRGIGGNVVFTGARDDVAHLLKVSDIGILPTLREGFSNALVECMAAGLPMVVSNVGGNPEAVTDGYNGYLISPEDTESLSSKIKLLAHDESLRKKMSQEALRRVERFSLTRMIEQTEKLYYDLLSRK